MKKISVFNPDNCLFEENSMILSQQETLIGDNLILLAIFTYLLAKK
ncbi:hypothetical protein SAMD00020551_3056 [Mesobacillus selenatarsenatis SF-1]|uniref:Uncharacterized protein n=1 Tax=Mesobacillus selenatarsenatis (strain DSM 18680 / JCM 14380 / FERM P-15431 / SF-1) TaxID=1321606 RepID=A0A0A8X9W4_MESS1|nr:hypothetical protein SAMD00020551_3056 [Mesobacillus selenatarsenatis SF-1]